MRGRIDLFSYFFEGGGLTSGSSSSYRSNLANKTDLVRREPIDHDVSSQWIRR
jgi:hypothetical protein